jgi:hypothetical protein
MISKYKAHQTAQTLFFEGIYSRKEIAENVGVSERTLYNWIKESSWEKQRTDANIAPVHILHNFVNQLSEMQKNIASRFEGFRVPDKEEMDIQHKLFTDIIKIKDYPTGLLKAYASTVTSVSDIVGEDEPYYEPAASPLVEYRPFARSVPEIAEGSEIEMHDPNKPTENELLNELWEYEIDMHQSEETGNFRNIHEDDKPFINSENNENNEDSTNLNPGTDTSKKSTDKFQNTQRRLKRSARERSFA